MGGRSRVLPFATRCWLVRSVGGCSLLGKQGLFAFDAPAVATQLAVTADDAVAGDDQRGRVVGACLGHSTCCGGLADGEGNLAVAAGFSHRDLPERFPYLPLER